MPWGKKEKKEKKAKERARSPAKEKARPRSPANRDLSRVWSPAHDDGKSPTAPAATWSSGPGLQPELSTVGQPVPEPPAPQLHPATGPAPLHELTQVQWLADGYVMNAADAPDAAKDEYRRLLRLCRNRTNQLGVRQTPHAGDDDETFEFMTAFDSSQRLAIAVPAQVAGGTAERGGGAASGGASPRESPGGGWDNGARCFGWARDAVELRPPGGPRPRFSYAAEVAQRMEEAFTRFCEHHGPARVTVSTEADIETPGRRLTEEVDFEAWSVTVTTKHTPKRGHRSSSSQSQTVNLHRSIDGVPLTVQLVAPEPDDDTPHETSSASSVATEPRLCGEKEDDGLKLCCRLNCNGELETIPGACRDGAGALQGGRLHFLVAVQLGLQEWGVRLLPQKDDGTLGCAAHLKWEMTADGKLISKDSGPDGEDLLLRLHTKAPEPSPLATKRWVRGHEIPAADGGGGKDETGAELRLLPLDREPPSPEGGDGPVFQRFHVADENAGERVLRANVRMKHEQWYQYHRRVVCVPPHSHIEEAARLVWDDPHSASSNERCASVAVLIEKFADEDAPLAEVAEIAARRGECLSRVKRFHQAERVYRTAVAEIIMRIGTRTAPARRDIPRSKTLSSPYGTRDAPLGSSSAAAEPQQPPLGRGASWYDLKDLQLSRSGSWSRLSLARQASTPVVRRPLALPLPQPSRQLLTLGSDLLRSRR